MAALAAGWLLLSWAVATYYDHNPLKLWWLLPIFALAALSFGFTVVNRQIGPWLTAVSAVIGAVAEQVWRTPTIESDSVDYVHGAFRILSLGTNPYLVPIAETIPPGALYVYPPGTFLVYGPFFALGSDGIVVARIAAVIIVLTLAVVGLRIGPGRAALAAATYGVFSYGAFRVIDGSTDTVMAMLLVVGVGLLTYPGPRAHWASAVVLGLAIAYKQPVWPAYLLLAYFLWRTQHRRHIAVSLGLAVATIVTFLIAAPGPFVNSVLITALTSSNHLNAYGLNLPVMLATLFPALPVLSVSLPLTLIGLGGSVAFFFLHPAKDLRTALLQGVTVTFIGFVLAAWTSPSYYMYLAAPLCLLIALYEPSGAARTNVLATDSP